MSAAATRTTPATPDMRKAGLALGAVTLAVALAAATFSLASSTKSGTAPLAGSAPAAHDHGWSIASSVAGQELIVRGSTGGGLRYTGIPYPAAGNSSGQELIVRGSTGGGLRYTGIPYPAAGSDRTGGANGTRLAR